MFLSILASIQSFPCPYTFVRHGEILRKKIKIIGWLIFSRAVGAMHSRAIGNRILPLRFTTLLYTPFVGGDYILLSSQDL